VPRQHATPLLIESLDGPFELRRLSRLRPLKGSDERRFPERLLQDLIHAHPEMLPVEELEPSFSNLRSVCTELPLGREESKYLDNLLINEDGRICLVECKLWRNPEAVRAVVAQTLDYAGELSRLTYEDLNRAVRRANRGKEGDVLADNVLGSGAKDGDRADFHDRVTRSLRLGNFLLLIVGDGIRAGLQQIAELLQSRAGLGFSLALIEMAIYGTEAHQGPYYVQPRLLLQTEVITRTVFIAGRDNEVTQIADVGVGTKPQTLSEQEFFANLAEQDPTYPEAVQSWLERCREIGVQPELRRSFNLKADVPTGGQVSLGSLYKDGTVHVWGAANHDSGLGVPIGRRYLDAVKDALGPEASVETTIRDGVPNPKDWKVKFRGKATIPLREMLRIQESWLQSMEALVEQMHAWEDNPDQEAISQN